MLTWGSGGRMPSRGSVKCLEYSEKSSHNIGRDCKLTVCTKGLARVLYGKENQPRAYAQLTTFVLVRDSRETARGKPAPRVGLTDSDYLDCTKRGGLGFSGLDDHMGKERHGFIIQKINK